MNKELEQETLQSEQIPTKKINILDDDPSERDLFSGNGHDRTATSLANALIELRDVDGAIGLEGKWGAGKSTVIKLAERKLQEQVESDYDYSMFTLDLWTTQTDGFRRGFLEAFITWLKKKSLLESSLADEYLDSVKGRTKRVKYSSVKDYNWLGIVFLALLPIMPILYAWLSPFAFNPQLNIDLLNLAPTILLGILILLYGSFLLRAVRVYKNDDESGKSFRKALSNSVSIFSKDVDQETITQDITEENPSTIEFETTFRKLLSDCQHNARNRTIIVLDNIDRLSKVDIPEVWSVIRSLFKCDDSVNDYPDSMVTVIIPYDREHILKAFDVNNESEADTNPPSFMSQDLIGKTFKRVFFVSPTVTSDWRVFFESKLSEAIPHEFVDESKYKLFKILDYYFQEHQIHPTPRQIINHINELAVLWQVWGDMLTIESLSIYTLIRARVTNEPSQIQKNLLNSRTENVIGDIDWRQEIAALVFNVDKEHAYEALLSQDISRLIVSEDIVGLRELSGLKGFTSVLTDVVHDSINEWANENPRLISNVVNNVSELDFKNFESRIFIEPIASTLPTLSDIPDEGFLEEFDGLIKLLQQKFINTTTVKVALDLVQWVNRNITNIERDPIGLGKEWADFISNIIDVIQDKDIERFLSSVRLPSNVEIILGIAKQLPNTPIYKARNLPINIEELEDTLKTKVSTDPELVLDILEPLTPQLSVKFFKGLQQYYADELNKETDLELEQLRILSDIFYRISIGEHREQLSDIPNQLVTSSVLLWHAERYFDEHDENLRTLTWFILSELGPDGSSKLSIRHPQLGDLSALVRRYPELLNQEHYFEEDITFFADSVGKSGKFSEWHEYAESCGEDNSIFRKVFTQVLLDLKFYTLAVTKTIYGYSFIKSLLAPQQQVKFLNKLSDWSKYFPKYFPGEKCLQIPSELISDIFEYDIEKLQKIIDVIDNYLQSIDSEKWEEYLHHEDDALAMLIDRQRAGGALYLYVNKFKPAVINHAKNVLEGNARVNKHQNDWGVILKSFRTPSFKGFQKEILKLFANTLVDDNGAEHFLLLYEELIKSFPCKKESEVLLDNLLIKLIGNQANHVHSFFINNTDFIYGIYKASSKDVKARFDEAFTDLKETTDDNELLERLEKLNALLKLK